MPHMHISTRVKRLELAARGLLVAGAVLCAGGVMWRADVAVFVGVAVWLVGLAVDAYALHERSREWREQTRRAKGFEATVEAHARRVKEVETIWGRRRNG